MKKMNNKYKEPYNPTKNDKKIKTITLTLELTFKDENDAKIVYSALNPEVRTKISRDVKSSIKLKGKQIFIFVQSSQLSKMRAVVNSYGRLISVIHKIVSVVKEVEK
jgi:tRNA threonylcarbamoyladenosine modification (KEOPS) complex  Pcc1 subunit